MTEVVHFSIRNHEVLKKLIYAEKALEHPLAQAIVEYGEENDIKYENADHFEAIPGHGIKATINGKNAFVGTRKLMKRENISYESHEEQL
ncbi:hypothetical protein ACFQ3N_16715 [Virgibacillus byunsanensis]|uniref:Uncharacterized protein n=1 Tax=Virgibacillus byunsanensis TaxID=570945 RepID=A0ABW3LPR0_9BACI